MEYVTLYNDVKIPILGYGVYQVSKEECERCVSDALKAGYRLIDSAQASSTKRRSVKPYPRAGFRERIFS